MFASICYAIEFMVAYKWKADFSNHLNKDEVHTVKKESRLRFLYGGHTAYHLIPLACIFNKPILILWFFAIFGNLFWIIMLFMQYRVVRKYAK